MVTINCMTNDEVRGWIQLLIIAIGGLIGIIAFAQNSRQRKIDNSFKLISWIKENWQKDEIDSWKNLVQATYEGTGSKPGQYVSEEGDISSLGDYFCEGSPDDGAFSRTAELCDIICYELLQGTLEERLVWFEFGQILHSTHRWIGGIEPDTSKISFLEQSYPSLARYFKKRKPFDRKWPSRVLIYAE